MWRREPGILHRGSRARGVCHGRVGSIFTARSDLEIWRMGIDSRPRDFGLV